MTREMPNYQKGKIYIIKAPNCDDVYIGSTTKGLGARLCNHRAHYVSYTRGTFHWLTVFKLMEKDGVYIELLEEYPCATKRELCDKESEWISKTPNCVNKNDPQEHNYNEYHRVWQLSYYHRNKETILQKLRDKYASKKIG